MAKIINSKYGLISGKIGDFVYKVRNGKQFVSAAPSRRIVDNSPVAISRRNRFSACSKISSALAKDKLLKSAWNNFNPYDKRSAFLKISEHIYPYVNEDGILSFLNRIAPDFGLTVNLEQISIAADFIRLEVYPFDESVQNAKYLCVTGFAFLSEPVYNNYLENEYLKAFESKSEYNSESKMCVSVWFNDHIKQTISLYKRCQFIIQFYLVDECSNVIAYSNSVEKLIQKS